VVVSTRYNGNHILHLRLFYIRATQVRESLDVTLIQETSLWTTYAILSRTCRMTSAHVFCRETVVPPQRANGPLGDLPSLSERCNGRASAVSLYPASR